MAIDRSGNALHWQDGEWSAPELIDLTHELARISCSPDRTCIAVDRAIQEAQQPYKVNAIRYADGQWQTPQPIDPGTTGMDVSCPTADFCVFVDADGRVKTFGQGSWSTAGHYPDAQLSAVDCISEQHCVITGIKTTLVLDGGTWQPMRAPKLYDDIECVDANFCIARAHSDIVEMHGGVWAPLPFGRFGYDLSVTCTSRAMCLADNYLDAEEDSQYFDAAFRGAAYSALPMFGTAVDCAPGPLCVELGQDWASVGQRS